MSTLTDTFDIALQLRGKVVEQILQAQHRAGVMRHHYVRPHNRKRVELLIDSPQLSLVTTLQADRLARAQTTSRVHYHSRVLSDTGDVGDSAVADVTVRTTLQISTGDPGPLSDGATLIVDCQETGRDDIIVYSGNAAAVKEVKDALLGFIGEQGGGYAIPRIGSRDQQIGSLAFRSLSTGSNLAPVLVVGMNIGDVVKGNKAGLQQVFVQQDWAMALASDFVLRKIRDSLRNHFGNQLPPPNGGASVQVLDEEVCTLPGPFGWCLDYSRQRVFIDYLDVVIQTGAISFAGRLRVTTSAFYVPDINANFTVSVTLSIGADQSLQISVGQTEVDVTGVFADIATFLSGRAIETIIRNGVQNALQTGLQQGQVSGFFSSELLGQFASLGSTANLEITPNATFVEIRSEAVIVHGDVNVMNRSSRPHANFIALRPENALTRRILHAGASWAPGGRIIQYHWDFGDGQSEGTAGNNARFVTEHDYEPGIYDTCLTVTDDLGRAQTSCLRLATARLSLQHTPVQYHGHTLLPWEDCQTADPIKAEFTVFDEQTPVRDALVRVEGRGEYRFEGYTDQQGKVTFQIDITNDRTILDGQGRGYMIVRASKDRYIAPPFERLVFVDCEQLFTTIDLGRKGLAGLLERLREFERVREPPDLGRPDIPPEPEGPFRPIKGRFDSYRRKVEDVGLALDVLTKLVILLERDSEALPIQPLLGVDTQEGEPLKILAQRFEESFSNISKALDTIREESRRLQVTGPRRARPEDEDEQTTRKPR